METKTKVIIAIVALSAAFATGRFLTPVKTVINTVEVEKKTEDSHKEKHKKTVIIERPDGSKETTITDDVESDKKSTDDKKSSSDTEITKTSSRLNISALAGGQISFSQPMPIALGASVTKDILGPISLGVWGLSNGVGGVSIGLTF